MPKVDFGSRDQPRPYERAAAENVHAVKHDGGAEHAERIADWVNVHGGKARYDADNGTVEVNTGRTWRLVASGDYVACHAAADFDVWPGDLFDNRYRNAGG